MFPPTYVDAEHRPGASAPANRLASHQRSIM